jgi:hypothetical protein
MSIAWTTVLIIALLLPGLFFFIGLATYERLSREVIRSGVVSEVGLAIAIALALHLLAWAILSGFGFRLAEFAAPLSNYDKLSSAVLTGRIVERLPRVLSYVLVTAAIGFGGGLAVARAIVSGHLRFLATHKWIYDLLDSDRKGRVVTAYVMTKTVVNDRALMYRGRLHEFFLGHDGQISYVTMKNCTRYFMTFDSEAPATTRQRDLFGETPRPTAAWDYLFIEGPNIANVLFEPSATAVKETGPGREALEAAVREAVSRQRPTRAPGRSS